MSPIRGIDQKLLDQDDHEPGVWEFDFHPPPNRAGLVVRQPLLDRLNTADAAVITVVAPSGYGKTTTLAQWAGTTTRGLAWLSLSETDNDPRSLFLRIAASVGRAGPATAVDTRWVYGVDGATMQSDVASMMRVINRMKHPFSLVLDNAHLLRSAASKGALRELVGLVEDGVQVIVSSRSDPDLPVSKLRAAGAVLEMTQDDLAMNEAEISLLLDSTTRSNWTAQQLLSVSGGWPAVVGLLLASHHAANPTGTGGEDHRFLADYVRSEILPQLPRSRREFLATISPLERVNGSLADAVTDGKGSSDLLRRLATSTHLVHPVDDSGDWFVVNSVLSRVLRSEFESSDPISAATVHAKAADWYRDHNMPLEAIGHAQKAGEADRFVDLMSRLVKERFTSGNVADVRLWMDWLDAKVGLDRHPNLAAIGAFVLVQEGRVLDSERWLEAASQPNVDSETTAIIRLVRALGTRSGVDQMLRDLDVAAKKASPGSRWTPAIMVTRGLAYLTQGATDEAERWFVEAARLGLENDSLGSVVLALGERALIAIGRQDWDMASDLSSRAMRIVDEYGLDGYFISAPALIASARSARHANDVARTNVLLARASLARPRLSAAIPGGSVQILTEMARAYVELSDVVGARALIREADDIVIQRPDLGVLPDRLETLRASLSALGPGAIGLSALTRAELRLLPFLATNLSFPEIGDQLYISRHTVKTQAMSIYRKLGTSSRSEAVAKAYEVGLLQH